MNERRRFVWFGLILIVLLIAGCASRAPAGTGSNDHVLDESGKRAESEMAPAQPAADGAGMYNTPGDVDEAGVATAAVDRKMIYTVAMHLIVQDTDTALAEIERQTQELGGFVANSNVWRSEGHLRASITVRVPAGQLEDALARFRAAALDIESEQVDSQDVTEEYVDLEARLTNEQRTETELQELLETRSERGSTEDILEVHRELSSVRAEIERIQGRMRYLDNLSDMATVEITLTPDELLQPIDVGGWQPQGTARDAVRMLLRTLQFFADVVIVFGIYILPVLVVIAIPVTVLVLIIRALVRRRRRARAA